MKRLILVVLALFLMVGVAQAQDSIWDKIKDHSVKVAAAYDGEEIEEALGGALYQDILGYKGIDVDVFLTNLKGEGLYNDDKNLLTGVSYNYYFGATKSWSAFVGGGVTAKDIFDIQKITDENNIEFGDKYFYAGLGKKFN